MGIVNADWFHLVDFWWMLKEWAIVLEKFLITGRQARKNFCCLKTFGEKRLGINTVLRANTIHMTVMFQE